MTRQNIHFSCIGLKAILLSALATFQLVSFAVDAQGSGTRWPTTEFKVVHRKPTFETFPQFDVPLDALLKGREEPDPQKAMADAAWERLIEGYLKDIATRYQEAGFEAPNLHGITHEGKKKYVVYLFDYNKSGLNEREALGAAHNVFDWRPLRKPWIVLDREDFTYESRLRARQRGNLELNEVHLYSTLAHELFHALQGTYDRKYGSIAGGTEGPGRDVVVEGGASGAAMYLISKKFPRYLETKESGQKYLGGFSYFNRFFDAVLDSTPDPYHTSSFWFHLAERFGSLSVIEYLLRRRLPGLTLEDRVRWLDGALKDHPGIKEGLYTIFPHFVTELASYGAGRYDRVTPSTWLNWVLWGCKEVNFSPGTAGDATVLFEFVLPLESRCISITWSGFPADGQLQVEAIGSDRDALDQLHLGIAGGEGNCWKFLSGLDPGKRRKQTCLLERLKIQTGPRDGIWAKTWELAPGGYGNSGRAEFILVNVAVTPWETKRADDINIRFGFTRTETQGKKLAPPDAEHIRLPPYGSLRELTYGLRKTKPMPSSPPIPEIKIPVLEISGKEPDLLESSLKGNLNRRKGTREYRVLPDFTKPFAPGYTGPLYGSVTLHDPNLQMGGGGIMSAFCDPEGKRPIGQVLQADEDLMKVHVKVDLCEVKMTLTPPFPKPPYPVVDHLDAVIVLPFGWRYFRDKAPVDYVTAGVQIFMDRYHERMQVHWGPQWPFISAPTGPTGPTGPGTGTGPAPGPGAGPGTGTGSGKGSAVGPGCDCSCESFNQLKELSKRRDAASQKKLKEMSMCAMQCMNQWTACAQSGTSP
jgi:hypothetical protein